MDLARFAVTFAVLLVGIGIGRLVLGTIGATGDVMATLFVPPDRTLGWPHGVQESDEPWAWRGGAAAAIPGGRPTDGADPPADAPAAGPSGPYVVPVERVRRR